MRAQVRAAFALHLASAWGLRTDGEMVAALEAELGAAHAGAVARYTQVGFFRANGTEDTSTVKRAVARAYGAVAPCARCAGSGRTPKPAPRCPQCGGTGGPCPRCRGSGLGRAPKGTNICSAKSEGCGGTGYDLDLAPDVPRTPTGDVSTDRDVLYESGDDTLEEYGGVSEVAKLRSTYLPALAEGVRWPINPRANVLVASGRTSYSGIVQVLPSHGTGARLRQAFVARPGHVLCSIDYGSLELCTLAQVCLWTVGHSALGEALNRGDDCHCRTGAMMIGIDYVEFLSRKKELKDKRQAAKAANFGFPGGMGAATLVLTKRKRSEGTTTAHDGTIYNGLRFCVLVAGARACGADKVTEWKGRAIPPTCVRCLEVVEHTLRPAWFAAYPEMREYFSYISTAVDRSGTLEQFGSGRIRGGLDFCNGANTLFQGLAADGAKHALWQVSREAHTDPSSPLWGSHPVIFVHDEIISELPEERAHEAAHRMAEIMVSSMREYVPDVRITAEPALMLRWHKAAEPTYVDGRLVPWEPKEKGIQ